MRRTVIVLGFGAWAIGAFGPEATDTARYAEIGNLYLLCGKEFRPDGPILELSSGALEERLKPPENR
jgi:hypothetical protein